MKKRLFSAFLTLIMLLTLIPATAVTAFAEESAELFAATCTVSFTCPSDVVVRVAKGFAAGVDDEDGVEIAKTSVSTEGDTSTYVFKLEEGKYRFLAQDVLGPTSNKYYNWDKNFLVTAEDVAKGTKTIDADPGLLANTGWEQKRDTPGYYVRQFTDELLASEASVVSEELKEKYAYVYTTPTFTVEGKARHQFTTQSEMEDFVAEWDAKTDYMTTYAIGRSKGDKHDLRVSVFTTTDLTGMSYEEAAAAVQANGKTTVLVHAQMHGDEQSGTEGALATVALLCDEYGAEAIEKINILLIPRVNPDGSQIYKYESGSGSSWRNVNRDSLEGTQPETKALIKLYNLFEPEACFDMHEFRATTDYNTESHLDDVRLSEQVFLNVPSGMFDVQYDIVDYMHEKLAEDGMRGYYYRSSPSTGPVTMRAYYALRGSISMLAEIPGQRKGSQQWDRRVLAQHLAVKSYLDYIIENADEVNAFVNGVKAEIATYGSVYDEDCLIVLDHNPGTRINAKRYIFDMADGSLIEHRTITNLYRNDSIGHARPRPVFYAVPKNASGIAKVLSIADMHGIEYYEVGSDKVMELRQYGGTYKMATLGEPQLYSFESGAYIFPVSQVRSNILCLLMEPDVLDAQESDSPYKASYVIQGHLTVDEIYRCENDAEHTLSFVEAKGATCDSTGNIDHYLCTCGKAFAANEHKNALAKEDYIIPVSGHSYVEQSDGSFTCSFNCGATQTGLHAAVAACDGIGGTVKLIGSKALTEALLVPAGVTLDLGEWMLEVPAGLVVNEGGKVTNGNICVSKTSGKVVNLGSNGGWVPVCYAESEGEALYALYPAAAKTGKDVTYLDNGTKYSFGYKLENLYGDNAYGMAAEANALGKIKFGVNVSLQAGGIDADYSFSESSVNKMTEVGAGADDFFKVNLTLIGAMVDDVVATPYIKVPALGFRDEGSKSTDFIPVTEVAAFGGENYTTLEAAVAAAEAAGGKQDVDIIADIAVKRPTTLKMNGNVRFVLNSSDDITISGPLTIDGQNMDGGKLLFQIQDDAKLTLKGITIQNYKHADAANNYGSVGRVEDNAVLVMEDCVIKNNTGARRGAFYITGSANVTIDNCVFEGNTALAQYGGALAVYNTTGVTVTNSSFINNSCATYGGAIGVSQYNANNGALKIENCVFEGNEAGENGGAIMLKSGALVIDGVAMSDSSPNDIEVESGTFELSGDVAIEKIKLASGKSIALNGALNAAAPIAIDAALAQTVLTGSKVADYHESFVGTTEDISVSETGKLLGAVVYVASVSGVQYESIVDAVAAANEAAAAAPDSTITISIFGDETFTEAVTVEPAANVQFSFSASVTLDGPLTIDGKELSRKIVPIAVAASDDTASGKTVTFKGTTIKNFHRPISTGSSGNYGAALRTNAYNTIVLDGATLTGNKGEIGGVYITSNGTLVVKNNSVVSYNESLAGFNQGVIFLNGTSSAIVASDSTFSNNTSATRAAVATVIGKKSSFTNCVFENNGGSAPGVIHMRNANSVLPIDGCTFANNTTKAVIHSTLGTTNVTNSTFTGNTLNVFIEGGSVNGVTND